MRKYSGLIILAVGIVLLVLSLTFGFKKEEASTPTPTPTTVPASIPTTTPESTPI